MLGLNYTITYKKGVENKVADALSRASDSDYQIMVISSIHSTWISEIQSSMERYELAQKVIAKLITGV